jgi:hypothetical protein
MEPDTDEKKRLKLVSSREITQPATRRHNPDDGVAVVVAG